MERNIRATKREIEAQKAIGGDTKELQSKLRKQVSDYHSFSNSVGIRAKDNRLRVVSSTSSSNKAKEREIKRGEDNVVKSTGNATIKISKEKKVEDVHLIGKIDKNIYKCITEDIVTDEVIITDERIRHIKARHPNDYESFCGYLKDIIEQPQYIVETQKPNTALILNEVIDGKEQFKTVLRLTTSCDNPEFKNSIITFMKINEKEWSRILRNKKILYKKE